MFTDTTPHTGGAATRRRQTHGVSALRTAAFLQPSPRVYMQAFKAAGPELVAAVKGGLPAGAVDALAERMQIPKEQLMATLGLAPATIRRKAAQQRPLSADESSRVLGMARLIGQVQAMVEESGEARGFDAAAWMAQWLQAPAPALGGRRPAEFMDTSEGQAVISRLLGQARSGAYA